MRGKLKQNQDHILQSSVLAEQFLGTIQNVNTWIDEIAEKIDSPIPSDQDNLIDLSSTFHALNREVSAKETSIDLLIEKGAMLLSEGKFMSIIYSNMNVLRTDL